MLFGISYSFLTYLIAPHSKIIFVKKLYLINYFSKQIVMFEQLRAWNMVRKPWFWISRNTLNPGGGRVQYERLADIVKSILPDKLYPYQRYDHDLYLERSIPWNYQCPWQVACTDREMVRASLRHPCHGEQVKTVILCPFYLTVRLIYIRYVATPTSYLPFVGP